MAFREETLVKTDSEKVQAVHQFREKSHLITTTCTKTVLFWYSQDIP